MDYSDEVPEDGTVYALSTRDGYARAEFIFTPGTDGADRRIAWRIVDRNHNGVVLVDEEVENLVTLSQNFLEASDDAG